MLHRFARIRHEFGTKDFAKVLLKFVGLVVMSLAGFVFLHSTWTALVAGAGLAAGWLFRKTIFDNMEALFSLAPKFLFIYGIVLTAGQLLSLGREPQLIIIAAATVILFNIQFWPLSDPSIINIEKQAAAR